VKPIVISVALFCSGLAVACIQEERVPPVGTSHRSASTVVVTQPSAGVTNAQPTPPLVHDVVERPPPTLNVEPPASGVTEAQPDVRSRARQVVGVASQQIDRLRRMESTSANAHHEDIDAVRTDLENKRERVLQGLREMELLPSDRAMDVERQVDSDVAALQVAIRSSYAIAPPAFQGLPQPSPLPPPSP
jgi:hypothetical protein